MAHVLIVGIGGFIGSVLRHWLSGIGQRWVQDAFPAGTLLVNALGCFAVGAFWGLVEYREWFSPETRIFATVGIFGGFTTFSAFGYETFALLHDREYLPALVNVGANVVGSIAAVMLGWMAAKAFAV
ncbi:MAG: fluoride efflux transporter CrcB [Pirellulales bacterium]